MIRTTLLFSSVALAIVLTTELVQTAPLVNTPATAVFTDEGMTIQSDGGDYEEGVDCVRSWFNSSRGNYYFRTVSNTFCDYPLPPGAVQRSLTLDFRSPVGGSPPCSVDDGHEHLLDTCGVNLIVDARLIADTLFKSASVPTPVTIHFDLYPNFGNDTAFMLTFIEPVPVFASGGARTLAAYNAVAELKVRRSNGKRSSFVVVGQYSMSFSLTVTPDSGV